MNKNCGHSTACRTAGDGERGGGLKFVAAGIMVGKRSANSENAGFLRPSQSPEDSLEMRKRKETFSEKDARHKRFTCLVPRRHTAQSSLGGMAFACNVLLSLGT